jgi:Adenylate and Guanylate cyclase catalytic domain
VPELPTGTVTFLFTDLEGSTHLWEEHPVAMHAALARHDEILRDAIAAHDGHVVKQRGDGFHAAFASASGALLAARDAQLALGYESWGETGALRVRMGVHTCQAEVRDGDYYGSAVNRAARLDERGPRRPDRRLAGNGRVGARFAPRRGGARRPWSGGGGGVGSERSGQTLMSTSGDVVTRSTSVAWPRRSARGSSVPMRLGGAVGCAPNSTTCGTP